MMIRIPAQVMSDRLYSPIWSKGHPFKTVCGTLSTLKQVAMANNRLILTGWENLCYQQLRPATHDDNVQTCASDARSVVIIDMVYRAPFETGLRYFEHTKTGCDGVKQAHSDRLASTFFTSN
jgi:hypothetical protein